LQIHSLSLGLAKAYLLENQAGLFLVDAGSRGMEDRVIRLMQKLGRDDLSLIYITHAHLDHYGSAAVLRRFSGAPIAIHHADEGAMANGETHLGQVRGRGRLIKLLFPLLEPVLRPERTRADVLFNGGDDLSTFGLDARVTHLPGHTPGSSCLIVAEKFGFVGDLVSSTGAPHTQRSFAADWDQLNCSLNRLKAMNLVRIYPGHGRSALNGGILPTLIDPTQS